MFIYGASARPETLIFLAWATRTNLRERLIQVHQEYREDADAPERVLRGAIKYSQPPVFEFDSTYGAAYESLFAYRLDRVDFHLVDGVLRGCNAVYMKDPDAALPDGGNDYSTPETGILWQSITENDRLLFHVNRIGRDCNGAVHRTASALRLDFTFHTPLLMRTPESSFLFQEFVSMSLEQVNWVELASLVLETPYQPGDVLQEEGKEDDYMPMQLALLKEMLWRGYSDFSEFGLSPLFSNQVCSLCLDLAEACYSAHKEVRKLEESHFIWKG
jgi:hypothetical protein